MFGIRKSKKQWNWSAYGKHAVVKDFLSIGTESIAFRAFSKWVDTGYHQAGPGSERGGVLAWRFLSSGPGKDLICGVIKDSHDSMGRKFPLMLMGSGRLSDWEDNWDLVPFACEKVWGFAENTMSRRYSSLSDFKKQLEDGIFPETHWKRFERQRVKIKTMDMFSGSRVFSIDYLNKINNIDGISRKKEVSVILGKSSADNLISFCSFFNLLQLMKRRVDDPPHSVFWGGTSDESRTVVYRRPLLSSDFCTLWKNDG